MRYRKKGSCNAPLETVQEVIDRDRYNPHAWHLLGQAYELGNCLSLAEKAFARSLFLRVFREWSCGNRACDLCPDEEGIWLSRGICNYKLNRLPIAMACLTRSKTEGNVDGTADVYIQVKNHSSIVTSSVF